MIRSFLYASKIFVYDFGKFEIFFPLRRVFIRFASNYSDKYHRPIDISWGDVLKHPRSKNIPVRDLSDDVCQHIVLAPIHNFSGWTTCTESIVGKSLSLQGHKVSVLNCESGLPACLLNIYGDHSLDTQNFGGMKTDYSKKAICRQCAKNTRTAYSNLGLNIIALKSYSSVEALEQAITFVDANIGGYQQSVNYRGINVAEHAFSSTVRHLLRGTLEENVFSKFLFRRFMISAVSYIDMLEKMTTEQKPDCFVCVHGVYLEHGVLVDFANLNGIRVVVHGAPYRKDTLWLAHGDTYHRTLVSEDVSRWKDIKMTDDKKAQVSDYMNSKISGGRENVNYNPDPILNNEVMCREIGLDINKKLVSVFTNTLWDAQVVYKSNIFDDMLDWLFSTIDFFSGYPDIQLAVRVHPAESKAGFTTNQPIIEEISKRYKSLPENVFIIGPESNVSSVLLGDLSSAAIIYATKLGLELAYRKIPLIVAGETLCRGKGFSVDPSSKKQYFDLLRSIGTSDLIDVETASVLAEKYAYHLFFNLMMDWPYVDSPVMTKKHATIVLESLMDILPGSHRSLDAVCEGILYGYPFENDVPR